MVRLAGWMGVVRRPWHTPYEHARMLESSLPAYRQEIEIITGEYVHHTFSSPPVSGGNDVAAAQFTAMLKNNRAWSRLRLAMAKTAFKRRLPKWLRGVLKV
jgi:hypothetical protein